MKKTFLSVIAFLLISLNASAIPGVKHFIKDNSGEFVYYRDKSFTRESYVGFLTYDETTYAARYFAPATKELPAKNIELLFTLNPKKPVIEITGERFVTPVTQDDVEIINYIHDLIYELGKRRQSIGEISPRAESDKTVNPSVVYEKSTVLLNSGLKSSEQFDQFGGKVEIYYDYLVPIFNVKKIMTPEGSAFETVAVGMLKGSDDRSFSDFVPLAPAKGMIGHKILSKKPAAKTYNFGTSSITLDGLWKQAGQVENMFFYGDSAMVGVGVINSWELNLYLKTCLLSAHESYLPWDKISIIRQDNQITVYSTVFTGTVNSKKINSFITQSPKLDKKQNGMLTMVVSELDYENEKKYFTAILKSWK